MSIYSRTPRNRLHLSIIVLFLVFQVPLLVFAEDEPIDVNVAPPDLVSVEQTTPDSPVESEPKDNLIPPDGELNIDEESSDLPEASSPPPSVLSSNAPLDITKGANRPLTTDPTSGALLYTYDLKIPPGRGGLTPNLKLNYNSQNSKSNDDIGTGWSLSIPYIERINKIGTNNLYTSFHFNSSFSGELVKLSTTYYVPKVFDGAFKYNLNNNIWTVTDKNGTIYTFGATSSSRQDDPNDSTKIYKWMLEEVRDTNNNFIKYEYYKDTGSIYPAKISYTGNGTVDGIFTINFTREARLYAPTSYVTGFKVQTNYRTKEIRADINGVWAQKYTLSYMTGDLNWESLLQSIIESGQNANNVVTTLPPVVFDYKTATPDWTYDPSWALPINFVTSSLTQPDFGMRMGDINGDGLQDIICHNETSNGDCSKYSPEILPNNGAGFDTSSAWQFPVKAYPHDPFYVSDTETFVTKTGVDRGLRLLDINGDNLADLVIGDANTNAIYMNTGTSWVHDSTRSLPLPFINGGLVDYGMRMADINGDGLLDILCHNENTNGGILCNRASPRVILNTGTDFVDVSSTWQFPVKGYDHNPSYTSDTETFVNSSGMDTGLRILDVNGDGLADLVMGNWNTRATYINTGSGWTYDPTQQYPAFINMNLYDYGFRNGEVNGDGFVDIACHNDKSNIPCGKIEPMVDLGRSRGVMPKSKWWYLPERVYPHVGLADTEAFVNASGRDLGLRLIDINGDNTADLVKGIDSTTATYINNTKSQINLLNKITYATGGSTAVEYKVSPQYKKSNGYTKNPNLPIIMDTVYKIIDNDGAGNYSTTEYSYEDGTYYFDSALKRKFAGFNLVTQIDPAGNVTKTYYHQGNSSDSTRGEYNDSEYKIAKPYRVESYDNLGNLYSVTVNKWDESRSGTDVAFVFLKQKTELTYDGTNSHKDRAESYTYDSNTGNIVERMNWGEVNANTNGSFIDTGTDISTTLYQYAEEGQHHIVNVLSNETTTDQNSNLVSDTRYYYDSLPLGSVTIGNQTKIERWVSGSKYVNTQKSYNSFGLPVSSTDERGKTTNYSYDSFNLYPIIVTNPLSQNTSLTYNYSSGQISTKTDSNNRTFSTTYDGLNRVTFEYQPDEVSGVPVMKSSYTYSDNIGSMSIKKTNYLDSNNGVDFYTYFDNFGRKIQEKVETEISGVYNTRDYTYDIRGLLLTESLPYESNGYQHSSRNVAPALQRTYTYDALGRVISMTDASGNTANNYNKWMLTVTDANGKIKKYHRDAYNNLTRVDEVNGGSTYSTYYDWNLNGKLMKIRDALNNVRDFSYDGLGRRITAEDLHSPSDKNYGFYTYSYDDAGNLTSVTDPNYQNIDYTYDDLNRILTEDYTGSMGTDVVYSYDTAVHNGVGRLKSVITPSVNTEYDYSPNGQMTKEIRSISGNTFTTSFTYDRQGNKLKITYPDASEVQYAYNSGGLLEAVAHKDASVLVYTDVITNINYSPTNQPTTIEYNNGQTTTNTYNPNQLYRLMSKVTSSSPTSIIQNFTYTYDAVGNITQIVDATNLASAKTMNYIYDDLHRLIQATATNANSSGPGNYTENYSYDAIGNILTKTGTAGIYSYTGNTGTSFANPHAVTSIGAKIYSYDNNGNLLSESGGNTYTWNYKNQLEETVTPSAVTATYSYDQDGNRVVYNDGTTITIYPNQYYNVSGGNTTKQIYAGSELVMTVDDTPSLNTRHYVHNDHLMGGNVISDASGALEQLLDYYPYGTIRLNQQNSSFNEQHKFTGKEYDSVTNLDYFGARYYYSDVGRFVSIDSAFWNLSDKYLLDPQQQNSYSYARNNPIKYIDPDGNSVVDVINNFVSSTLSRTYSPVSSIQNSNNSSSGYKITFGSDADPSTFSSYSNGIMIEVMKQSDNHSPTITSTTRTPERQAEIMFSNIKSMGIEAQKKLYGQYGDQVIDKYPDLDGMTSKIYELGPTNVSSHIRDPEDVNVFDIAPSSIQNKAEFISAIKNNSSIDQKTFFSPPKDKSFHIQIKQPKKP